MNDALLQERRQILTDLFHSAPIAQSMGMRMHYLESGEARFEMNYHRGFDHALGGIHGGVLATLIDNAGWFTAAPYFDHWIATVEFSTRLLEPVTQIDLVATGHLVRRGKRLAVTQMEVHDSKNKLIAVGSGTFSLTSVPIVEFKS